MLDPESESVVGFAITVTHPRFRYRTRDLTFEQLDIRLGHTRFSAIKNSAFATLISYGARRLNAAQAFYLGNPGGYQTYVLAFNDAGHGHASPMPSGVYGEYATGAYEAKEPVLSDGWTPEIAERAIDGFSVNTLVIFMDHKFLEHRWTGVDLDRVRLLGTSSARRRRRRIQRRIIGS
jgi:hypothetical protein